MDTALAIGIIGMLLLLFGFILNIFKRLETDDKRFLLMNFIGSALLAWYALLIVSVPFLVLNAAWAASALWGVFHHHIRKR